MIFLECNTKYIRTEYDLTIYDRPKDKRLTIKPPQNEVLLGEDDNHLYIYKELSQTIFTNQKQS